MRLTSNYTSSSAPSTWRSAAWHSTYLCPRVAALHQVIQNHHGSAPLRDTTKHHQVATLMHSKHSLRVHSAHSQASSRLVLPLRARSRGASAAPWRLRRACLQQHGPNCETSPFLPPLDTDSAHPLLMHARRPPCSFEHSSAHACRQTRALPRIPRTMHYRQHTHTDSAQCLHQPGGHTNKQAMLVTSKSFGFQAHTHQGTEAHAFPAAPPVLHTLYKFQAGYW